MSATFEDFMRGFRGEDVEKTASIVDRIHASREVEKVAEERSEFAQHFVALLEASLEKGASAPASYAVPAVYSKKKHTKAALAGTLAAGAGATYGLHKLKQRRDRKIRTAEDLETA